MKTFFLEVFYGVWYTALTGFLYGVDNVIVATPEHEAEIFADNFDPHGLAVQPEGKTRDDVGTLEIEELVNRKDLVMTKCALISGRGMGLMHGGNFHNHPDAEVVAVCDMDPELLAKAGEQFGVPGYPTIEELLANCDVDLVLLIVNETRRIPPLHQLLKAGQNVFTEKPLCGLEGQDRLREEDLQIAAPAIATWRDSHLKFGIDFNYRFMHHFRKLHDDVAENRLGEIKMVHARAHFNCWSHVIDQILWTVGRTRMGECCRGSE